MSQSDKQIWGVIPARGGSKSIPHKNLVEIGGKTLIERAVLTARRSKYLNRLVLSTDDSQIAAHARSFNLEVHDRPRNLAEDDTPINEVLVDLIDDPHLEKKIGAPDLITLIQVTSPFLRSCDIDNSIVALLKNPEYQSAQTVSECQHNSHAINQREMFGNQVSFAFRKEREKAYNKQRKSTLYLFGNVVSVRAVALRKGHGVFAEPSFGVPIPHLYSFDLDKAEEILIAETLQKLVDSA